VLSDVFQRAFAPAVKAETRNNHSSFSQGEFSQEVAEAIVYPDDPALIADRLEHSFHDPPSCIGGKPRAPGTSKAMYGNHEPFLTGRPEVVYVHDVGLVLAKKFSSKFLDKGQMICDDAGLGKRGRLVNSGLRFGSLKQADWISGVSFSLFAGIFAKTE
jgi:hypothetical protein